MRREFWGPRELGGGFDGIAVLVWSVGAVWCIARIAGHGAGVCGRWDSGVPPGAQRVPMAVLLESGAHGEELMDLNGVALEIPSGARHVQAPQ